MRSPPSWLRHVLVIASSRWGRRPRYRTWDVFSACGIVTFKTLFTLLQTFVTRLLGPTWGWERPREEENETQGSSLGTFIPTLLLLKQTHILLIVSRIPETKIRGYNKFGNQWQKATMNCSICFHCQVKGKLPFVNYYIGPHCSTLPNLLLGHRKASRAWDIGLQTQLLKSLKQGHNEFKAHVFMETFWKLKSGLWI